MDFRLENYHYFLVEAAKRTKFTCLGEFLPVAKERYQASLDSYVVDLVAYSFESLHVCRPPPSPCACVECVCRRLSRW